MKLSDSYLLIKKGVLIPLAFMAIVGTSSCDSVIFDEQGDCSVHYRLSFRYTKNILNADAFSSQVSVVNVAMYDQDGRMVYRKCEQRQLTEENDFRMDVDVSPGTYDIIAWCEGPSVMSDAKSFIIEGQDLNSNMHSSGAYLQLSGSEGYYYSDQDINRLYFGALDNVEFADTYGTVDIEPIYLTKDTNHITVQLQNMDGMPIDPAILSFTIECANSRLNWQNHVVGDLSFIYMPWAVESTLTGNQSRATLGDSELPSGVIAEFSTGRLLVGTEQYLTVKLKDGADDIFRIPLVQYLLLVRGHYSQALSEQDYLDRCDDFTLTFFVDEAYTWIKSKIYINNWRVVPTQNGGIDYED